VYKHRIKILAWAKAKLEPACRGIVGLMKDAFAVEEQRRKHKGHGDIRPVFCQICNPPGTKTGRMKTSKPNLSKTKGIKLTGQRWGG
jgi:hypothetical protein